MQKPSKKLTVTKQTIRVLGDLTDIHGGWIRPPISWSCPQPPPSSSHCPQTV